jgi:hypothetical protein
VLAQAGHAALALAARGPDTWRVARLDLWRRAAAPWGTLHVRAFADEHDGDRWFVSDGATVRGLDVLAPSPRASVVLDKLGEVLDVAAGPRSLGIASSQGGWGYEVARGKDPVLRARTPLDPEGMRADIVVSPSGALVERNLQRLTHRFERQSAFLEGPGRRAVRAGLAWHAVAIQWECPAVELVSHLPLTRRAMLRLPGVDIAKVHLRLQSDALVVADALGRVTVLSLASGELVRTLRIRWP